MSEMTLDWVRREMLTSAPGVFLFTASEGRCTAVPFDVAKLVERDRVSADVYDSNGVHLDGRKIMTRDAAGAFAARYTGSYIFLARLEPELAELFERRYGNGH